MDSINKESPDLPKEVTHFYDVLLRGKVTNESRAVQQDDHINRRVKSLASDAFYATSRGSVKLLKHTQLGLCVSSLTGSKSAVNTSNTFGNTISYKNIKQIETEFAYSSITIIGGVQNGILKSSTLPIGFAFDNYDGNLETVDGHNSLLITTGILYQNYPSEKTDRTEIKGQTVYQHSIFGSRHHIPS